MKYLSRPGLLFLVMMITTAGMTQTTKKSTANSRVQVLDTAFYIPQLKRHRRIWICLPRDYARSKATYPVLYLQDGQNIFDTATSFSGEWGVDEAMDTLGPRFGECIIVAVDNGGEHRLSEYSPFDFTLRQGGRQVEVKAAGTAYLQFLLYTLRPFLKRNFRISPEDTHHFIAGSSMGGLIAYAAVLQHPGKWGGAGVLSPAFWVVRQQLMDATRLNGKNLRTPIYFYAGQQESTEMVPDMLAVVEALEPAPGIQTTSIIRAGGQHNETSWRKEFPLFYEWMMNTVRQQGAAGK